jgi:hypothetical protein
MGQVPAAALFKITGSPEYEQVIRKFFDHEKEQVRAGPCVDHMPDRTDPDSALCHRQRSPESEDPLSVPAVPVGLGPSGHVVRLS